MSRVDFSTFQGERFVISGQITEGGVGWPPDATGATLQFLAWRKAGDTTALVDHDLADGKVTLTNPGLWEVQIEPSDTSAFTGVELLFYTLKLAEAGAEADVTVVQHGTWKIKPVS